MLVGGGQMHLVQKRQSDVANIKLRWRYQFSGEIGNFLFRDYLQSLPDVQKMVITTSLIRLTYRMQYLIAIILSTNSLHRFAPNFVVDSLLSYPGPICFVLSTANYVALVPISILVMVLTMSRSIKRHFPLIYNTLNHDRISFCVLIFIYFVSSCTFVSQFIVCGNSCQRTLLVNFFLEVLSYSNYNHTIDDFRKVLSEKTECFLPFSEFAICLSFLLIAVCGTISIGNFLNKAFRGSKKEERKELMVSYNKKPRKMPPVNRTDDIPTNDNDDKDLQEDIFNSIQHASTMNIVYDYQESNEIEIQQQVNKRS